MNLDLGKGGEPAPRAYEAGERTPQWQVSRHLQEIAQSDERVMDALAYIVELPVMKSAIARALEKADDALALDLATSLHEVYPDLGESGPRTVADLDARAGLQDPGRDTGRTMEEMLAGIGDPGTSGTARDYMMNRIGGVQGLAQVMEQSKISLPPALESSLQREADRLATLLIAFERAEREGAAPADKEVAA